MSKHKYDDVVRERDALRRQLDRVRAENTLLKDEQRGYMPESPVQFGSTGLAERWFRSVVS